MKIYKLEDYKQIFNDPKISAVISQSMFNPTAGRIKSAAEGVYAKEQGRFYIASEEETIGILGVRRVDNAYVEILHFAVDAEHRNKGVGTALVNYMEDVERVDEIIARPDEKSIGFFKAFGFDIDEEETITGSIEYVCTYRLKG